MNRQNRSALFAFIVCLFCLHAQAATISIEPASASVVPGSAFSVAVVISGLGDTMAPSLGDFDMDIIFDPSDLALINTELGSSLGDVSLGDAIDVSFGMVSPGVINLAEVSFLSVAELNALQPDAFVLATLNFMATNLTSGQSTLIDILGVQALGDALGAPLAVDSLNGAVVTAIVPLPSAIWFFVSALGVLIWRRKL